ncbi:MAG TPA: thioredoxin family protein [Synechococcales cyanobacterium M55_K2018_004]|nr:thioredoxin family protein [Synechococcales cyanobacterium M55_K2018_004]
MTLAVIKFSSEDCGLCHKMSHYDQKVAEELGMSFVDVKMQDTPTYRKYRKILLTQYPDKAEMGWPTYIICEEPEGEFKIIGEVKGAHPKGELREKLQAVMAQA